MTHQCSHHGPEVECYWRARYRELEDEMGHAFAGFAESLSHQDDNSVNRSLQRQVQELQGKVDGLRNSRAGKLALAYMRATTAVRRRLGR